MYNVFLNNISMHRGDDAEFNVVVTDNTGCGEYTLQDGDSLKFSMKKNMEDSGFVLTKNLNAEKLFIAHNDTAGLDFGTYVYDIQITFANGRQQTIIVGNLELEKEVGT